MADEILHNLFLYKKVREKFNKIWEDLKGEQADGVSSILEIEPFPFQQDDLVQKCKNGQQEVVSYDEMKEVSTEAQTILICHLKAIVSQMTGACVLNPGIKSEKRCREKANDDYNGRYGKLFDVSRAAVTCDDLKDIVSVFHALKNLDGVEMIRCKNRFASPLFTGYRDFLLNLKINLGPDVYHVAEVQLSETNIWKVKGEAHELYEYFRSYFKGRNETVDERLKTILELSEISDSSFQDLFSRLSREGEHELLYKLGSLCYEMGRLDVAAEVARKSLEIRESLAAQSASLLGLICDSAGNFQEAQKLHRRSLEANNRNFGPEDPNTLTDFNNLALVLNRLGNFHEAEELHRHALAQREQTFGPNDPKTLVSIGNLGSALQKRGTVEKLQEALSLHSMAFNTRSRVLGDSHAHTLASLNDVGVVQSELGKNKEAEENLRSALEKREQTLGPDHFHTLASLINLGSVVQKRDLAEGEKMLESAMEASSRILGPDHPDTLKVIDNLAFVRHRQRNSESSEALFRRALAGWERILKPNHLDALLCKMNLGVVLRDGGDLSSAAPLLVEARSGFEVEAGPYHKHTLLSIGHLAFLLEKKGDDVGANELKQLLRQRSANAQN